MVNRVLKRSSKRPALARAF